MWFYRKCIIDFLKKPHNNSNKKNRQKNPTHKPKKVNIKPSPPVLLYIHWYKTGKGHCGEVSREGMVSRVWGGK